MRLCCSGSLPEPVPRVHVAGGGRGDGGVAPRCSASQAQTTPPHHLHRRAAGAARGHLRQDALPRRRAQGTARPQGRPQGGESRGQSHNLALENTTLILTLR